jgi:hypothetical protein
MTNEDYSKVPPPHLLKKFSEQAREDSQKRGRPGYYKTFAKLCIDWALNSKSSPNNLQIRSSDITPPPELVQQWIESTRSDDCIGAYPADLEQQICVLAAQYGADQELEACCEWFVREWTDVETADALRAARRPKPPSLKEQALALIDECTDPQGDYLDDNALSIIRRALEQLPDHK